MLEGSFGFLTDQVKRVHRDLLTFQTQTEHSFSEVNGRFDKVDGRLDRLDKGVRDLRKDLPDIVGTTLREVLDERRK